MIALLALFFALGGSALATSHYLITSTSQIKPSVLKKLKGSAGLAGPAGAQGPAGGTGVQGPAGAQGPAGPSNLSGLAVVNGATVEVEPGKVGGALAFCPAGSRAVSGGGNGSIAGIADSQTSTGREGWFIIIVNETVITLKINAQVLCAGAGQAVAASGPRARRARAEQNVEQLVARLTAERQASKR
ncbi:MAG: hypothetical protein ACHQAV_04140 [Solirubrobacterales bacterium]